MSDYFTRLAARTLGLAATLQPKIAPIFAQEQPLQQAEAGLFESFTEDETPARNRDARRRDEHEQRQPRSIYESFEQSSASQPTTEERAASQDERKGHPYILRAYQQPVPLQVPSASESFQKASIPAAAREAQIVHEEMTLSGAIRDRIEPISIGSAEEQRSLEAGSARPLPPIERNSETDALATSMPRQASTSVAPTGAITQQQDKETMFRKRGVVNSVGAMSSPDKGGRASGDGSTPFTPSVISRASAQRMAEMSREQKQPEQAPPTIQVTIGRVEVRATPPPSLPAAQRQIPTPPLKSLDDYLRQREEGRVR
jgi:hypothetical protein